MPEIKNTFTQGKMNKDLDERLIPKGQYRDALNIEVSTSEGSDVGTVQNILGNVLVGEIIPQGFECIGCIADEKNEKIYWYITSETYGTNGVDAIVEYDIYTKSTHNVIVDTLKGTSEAVLEFTRKHITAINIVDDFLLWTDGNSEPRIINIKRCKDGCTIAAHPGFDQNSFDENTYLFIDGVAIELLKKEHTTVIKKRPLHAPTTKINSKQNKSNSGLFEKIFPRFALRYKYIDNQYSAIGPFTNVVFNPEYLGEYDQTNAFTSKESHNTAMVNCIESIDLFDFIDPNIPKDVIEVEILYKQENSTVVYNIAKIKKTDEAWNSHGSWVKEWEKSSYFYDGAGNANTDDSTIIGGGETNLQRYAYMGTPSYRAQNYEGYYPITSENIYNAIPEDQMLRPWDSVPTKALAQEITGNRVVYGNYTQGYNMVTATNNPVSVDLKADYEKRFASYTGYILEDVAPDSFKNKGLPSIKSQRDYQIGVVFGDEYGRETPVITSSNSGIKVPWESVSTGKNSSQSLILKSFLNTEIPYWADYYKFYVKETSGEYYNLAMSRAYRPGETSSADNKDEYVWLAFDSSDRNKITEDGYLILKKIVSPEASQIYAENRYKILDISNEAPDSIAYGFTNLGTVANSTTNGGDFQGQLDDGGGAGANGTAGVIGGQDAIFPDATKRIDVVTDTIEINIANWRARGGLHVISSNQLNVASRNSGLYLSWKSVSSSKKIQNSKRYKVDNVDINNNLVTLKLAEKISKEDVRICEYDLGDQLLYHTVVTIERKERLEGEEFSGKFFVKISKDDIINNSILSQPDNILVDGNEDPVPLFDGLGTFDYSITTRMPLYRFADIHQNISSDLYNEFDGVGLINQEPYPADPDLLAPESTNHSGANITSTSANWDAVIARPGDNTYFFIDDMFVKAVQTSNDTNYARYAGNGFVSNPLTYQDISWGEWNYGDEFAIDEDGEPYGDPISYYGWGTPDPQKREDASGNILNFNSNYLVTQPAYKSLSGYYASGHEIDASVVKYSYGNIVNSMPGVVTIDNRYDNTGPQSFVKNLGDNKGDGTYKYNANVDTHYIHISFPAPGVDLHDGNFTDANYLTSVDLTGYNSLGRELQGIWGGGVATHKEASAIGIGSKNFLVEFEGNYAPNGDALLAPPGPGIGVGYNMQYKEQHDRQWDPTYPTDPDGKIKSFLDKLVPGSKFKFAADSDKTVYLIKSVTVKKLYNHTTWRSHYHYKGTTDDVIALKNNSVEQRAANWGYHRANNPGTTDENNAATNLRDEIVRFGQANNRRVCYILEVNKDTTQQSYNLNAGGNHPYPDMNTSAGFEFLKETPQVSTNLISTTPAIFETEPKDSSVLNIFHETNSILPTKLTKENRNTFIPAGSIVEFPDLPSARIGYHNITDTFRVRNFADTTYDPSTQLGGDNRLGIYSMEKHDWGFNLKDENGEIIDYIGQKIRFYKPDGSYITSTVVGLSSDGTYYTDTRVIRRFFHIDSNIDPSLEVGISYNNCFSFGNGIESDRIRDDFNQMTISNGPKVSTTIETNYKEENRLNGLIYSGIYNSTSSINNLNQFIIGQKITKDINPTYGSIQKLFSRKTDLVALCEDKVIKILANKDALFNADGNIQIVASENVLGQSVPFVGDYGISKNPESFSSESYRAYFTDANRGAVLRLSMDGLTPISDAGMHDYFRDNFDTDMSLIGTYDDYKRQYNLTIKSKVDFPELIQNSYIEDGDPLVQLSTSFANLIQNGVVGGGTAYEHADVQALTTPSENLIQNPYFSHHVRIRNFAPIGVGEIIAGDPGAAGQEFIEATYEQGELLQAAVAAEAAVATTYETFAAGGGAPFTGRIFRAELGNSNPPFGGSTDGHPFKEYIPGTGQSGGYDDYIGVGNQDNPNGRVWFMREIMVSASDLHDYDGNTYIEYTGNGSSYTPTGNFYTTQLAELNPNSGSHTTYYDPRYDINGKGWVQIDNWSGNSGLIGTASQQTEIGWSPSSLGSNTGQYYQGAERSGPKIYYDYGDTLSDETVSWISGYATSENGPSGIVFSHVGKNEEARITFPETWVTGHGIHTVSQELQDANLGATNRTLFHGEMVQLSFKLTHEHSTTFSNYQTLKVEILDGSNIVDSVNLETVGLISNPDGTFSIKQSSVASGITIEPTGSHQTGDIITKDFEFIYEIKDPTLTQAQLDEGAFEENGPVISDLKFRVTIVGSTGTAFQGGYFNIYYTPPFINITEIDISKIKRINQLHIDAVTGSPAVYGPDVLIDPGQEFIAAGTGAIAAVPSVSVPGWAQVTMYGETYSMAEPEHWGNSTGPVDYYYGTKQIYGEETAGPSSITESGETYYVPPNFTLANAATYQDNSLGNGKYSWNGNDVVSYDEYPGSATSSIYTEAVIRVGNYPDIGETATYGDKAKVKSTSSSSAFMNNTTKQDYIIDNWYLTDIEYDETYAHQYSSSNYWNNAIRGVITYDVVTANGISGQDAMDVNHNMTSHHSYDLYPSATFGQISGNINSGTFKSLRVMPAYRNEYGIHKNVGRAIHQRVQNSQAFADYGTDEFRLQGYNCDYVVTSIHQFNVTGPSTNYEPPNWNTPNFNYENFNDSGNYLAYTENAHAIKTVVQDATDSSQDVTLAKPVVYYKNNSLCFDTVDRSDRYWLQSNLTLTDPNVEGYTVSFFVDQNPYTNTIEGALAFRISNGIGDSHAVNNSLDATRFYGTTIENITQFGDYKVRFNFDDSLFEVVDQPPNSNIVVNDHDSSTNTNAYTGGHDNLFILLPDNSADSYFVGAVNGITITDNTNYFTGGGVDFWTFGEEGGVPYNELQNPYMYWDDTTSPPDGFIVIDNAPDGSTIEQNIDLGTSSVLGYQYEVSFDYNLSEGGVQFSYFTSEGGFVDTVIGPGSGTYTQILTISDQAINPSVNLIDTFLVTTVGETSGSLDNFSMKRVVTTVEERTLSFSEDVKGWVSFKSFIPESGLSIGKQYYTFKNGQIYHHYVEEVIDELGNVTKTNRNNFYGQQYHSYVEFILNDAPSSIKSFNTLNYEGSQSYKEQFVVDNTYGYFDNISIDNFINENKEGWSVVEISTDLESGSLKEFIEKEGKWFGKINGVQYTDDTSDFTVQGIDFLYDVDTSMDPYSGSNNT